MTALYAALFAGSGAALLLVVNVLAGRRLPRVLTRTISTTPDGSRMWQTTLEGETLPPVKIPPERFDAMSEGIIPTPRPLPSGPHLFSLDGESVGVAPIGPNDSVLITRVSSAMSEEYLRWSILAFVLLLVVSVALGYLLAGRMLAPIQRAFDSERRLIATMSHELRTPLATQRTILETAIPDGSPPGSAAAKSGDGDEEWLTGGLGPPGDGDEEGWAGGLGPPGDGDEGGVASRLGRPGDGDAADQVSSSLRATQVALEQNMRASRIIDAMLTLTRAGRRGAFDPEALGPVDLTTITHHVLDQREGQAQATSVTITRDLEEEADVLGDGPLLERLVDNLVANALIHNDDGGWVKVDVSAEDGLVRLTVANSGSVVPPETVPDLVQPFRRGGRDRTDSTHGQGLGLTIVHEVATYHGGTLALVANPEGGLTATVTLPGVGAEPRQGRRRGKRIGTHQE